MNKTFYGLTSNVNGLLNLDHSDTHNIDAKRCKVNNDSATYLWHCRFGHIGVKRMKKLHKDGFSDLDRSDAHIHNIEAKRCKVNNDSATYMWHCHLGHIGVKRMKKLHTDGLLEPLDYESLGTCEPCHGQDD